jgi:cobyric acid synthase
MLRQANQYNVPMPTTYNTEVQFLRVKDIQEEILALEGGIDILGRNIDEKSTYTAQQPTTEDLEYGSQ